ncbi:hypothetical protein QTP88_012775 [Uroleucon formosanum]
MFPFSQLFSYTVNQDFLLSNQKCVLFCDCLNDFLFNYLSLKISNFKSEALDCILCADEMSLKTNLFYNVSRDKINGFHESISLKKYESVKYALVLMIRGINHNWKQPIAYFLVSSSCTGTDLKDIILTTIYRLQSINLNVKAFVTDKD